MRSIVSFLEEPGNRKREKISTVEGKKEGRNERDLLDLDLQFLLSSHVEQDSVILESDRRVDVLHPVKRSLRVPKRTKSDLSRVFERNEEGRKLTVSKKSRRVGLVFLACSQILARRGMGGVDDFPGATPVSVM